MQLEIDGLDRLIKRLEQYRKSLDDRKKEFLERLAEIGVAVERTGFSNADYDGTNDVTVEDPVWIDDNTIAVRATGASVLFIEFGTGITYPEHPQADEFNYHHGTYGKGLGANPKGWIYEGEQGTCGIPVKKKDGTIKEGIYRTYGNPPARAAWNASKEMRQKISEIAREVFASD